MASFSDVVADARATKKYLANIQKCSLQTRREACKERYDHLISVIKSSQLSAHQAADLNFEVQGIWWAKKSTLRKKRVDKLMAAIHQQLLTSSIPSCNNSANASNSANSDSKYQDFRAIVNYIPDSLWGRDGFDNDLLLLARDLGLVSATEESIGALALLTWLNEVGSLENLRRVSPSNLYSSVKTCKKSEQVGAISWSVHQSVATKCKCVQECLPMLVQRSVCVASSRRAKIYVV